MAPIRSRVEVTDLAPPQQLRAVQTNIDTYVQPEKRPIDNDAQRLAEALQGFSKALAGFGKVDPHNDPRVADAYQYMSSSQDGQLIQDFQQGKAPWQTVPHIRGLYEAQMGTSAARMATEEVKLGVQDGSIPLVDNDGNPIDASDIIARQGAKYSSLLPGRPDFQKSFYGGINTHRHVIDDLQRNKVAEINREKSKVLVNAALEDVVRMASEGKDDDTLNTELNRRVQLAQQKTGYRPADTQALFVGRIRELARQDPDAAERLLKLDRTGFDGQKVGSIVQNPAYRKDVTEIVQAMTEEREKRFDVTENEKIAAEDRARLEKADGSFSAITNHAYTNPFALAQPGKNADRMITREARQDKAIATFLRDSDYELRRQGAAGPAAAETKFRREYEVFVNNNRPHPVWQSTLETTGRILSNPASLSKPENVAQVAAAAELYNTLNARNPGYLSTTLGVKDREQKFYDQYNVYRRALGDPENEAARKAADFINNPPPPLTGEELKNLRDKADKLDLNGWYPGGKSGSWFGELGAQNIREVRQQVFDTAKAMAADRKVPIDKVMDAALDTVSKRATLFNGQMIPPSPFLTNESKPFYQKRLDELYTENKDLLATMGIKSSAGLSLREDAPGVFRVIGTDGQTVIIPDLDSKGAVKSYDTLRVHAKDIDTIRAKATADATAAALLQSNINANQGAVDRKEWLDRQQAILDKSSLGGEFAKSRQKMIDDERKKLEGVDIEKARDRAKELRGPLPKVDLNKIPGNGSPF